MSEHFHGERWVATGEVDEHGEPIRELKRGAAACPLCSKHDHSDTRIAGWIGGVPVKCWEVNCPACGHADVVLTRWTDAGAEARRAVANRQPEGATA